MVGRWEPKDSLQPAKMLGFLFLNNVMYPLLYPRLALDTFDLDKALDRLR